MQNSDTPKVSLLVPICNVERYLRECLDSAVAQTLKDIEIICINDGSTDSSPDIIREYMERDPRVKIIDKANSGYGDSMNRGLEMARGEYVGILESDDFMFEDSLQKLVAKADAEHADVVKGDFYLYWSTPSERIVGIIDEHMTGAAYLPSVARAFSTFHLSAIYRREFLNDNRFVFAFGSALTLRFGLAPSVPRLLRTPFCAIARITRRAPLIRPTRCFAYATNMPRCSAFWMSAPSLRLSSRGF
ncbi:MAG: glycosyltransferase family 2 protein [Collinsella aerofaciens]